MTGTVKLGQAAKDRVKQLQEMSADPEKHQPVPLAGLIDLNKIFRGGVPRSKPFYIAIIGREKRGKSTLGKQMFLSYCEQTGEKGCIYDLEESIEETADRALVMRAGITSRGDIYQLNLGDRNFEELSLLAAEIDEYQTYVNDELSALDAIFEDARKNGFKVVCIDNFQLLTDGSGGDQRSKLENLSKRIMKARKLGLKIFLLSQGSPDQQGSFGSSQVLKDANATILIDYIYEDKKGKVVIPGTRKLVVMHSRFSPTGECEVIFDGNFSRVRSVTGRRLDGDNSILTYEIQTLDEGYENQGELDDND